MSGYHELPRVQHFHRALGGYIETYSQGVATMRHGIEAFLTPANQDWPGGNPLFHILFAGMTAKPLADAFFGMATAAAALTEQEITIRNVLRREWDSHTTFRNDLAHAEWAVGWENAETGEPIPPASIRIKTVEGVPTLTDLRISTNAIIAEINTLIPLVKKTQVFSRACQSKQRDETQTILGHFDVVEPSGDERRTVLLRES